MPQNKNTAVNAVMQDVSGLYPTIDDLPTRINCNIQFTEDINPNHNRALTIFETLNSSGFNIPDDKDFYLVGFILMSAAATGSGTYNDTLTFTKIDGTTQQINCISDGTATSNNITFVFPHKGLLLKRGSLIYDCLYTA